MNRTKTIKKFKINKKVLDNLSANERKLLPILMEAAEKIDEIYRLQERHSYPWCSLYPSDVTKAEVEEAARRNPKIFSPFTVVERDTTGKLIAIDYHLKYSSQLLPIAKLLKDAASKCKNQSFKKYLRILATSLVKSSYQKADAAWLAVKGSNLDVIIGPHERYLDKLFFVKRVYQACIGIIDHEKTKKAKIIRDILYTTIGQNPNRVMPPAIVNIEVLQCLMTTGFLGRFLFSRQHLPSDPETTQRHGSKIIGYLSSVDLKFEKLIYPIFNAIFEINFKARYSKDLLKNGNYYYVLLTAIAQQLHRYQNSRVRLKELFPIFDEANCVVSGIQSAKNLILKGAINQKELEAIIIALICWMFSEWIIAKQSKAREDYLKGDALTFNFLVEAGAIQQKDGISWPNFAKIFFEMENLASIFTHFLEEGEYLEAQEFLSKYLSLEPFEAFDKHLSKIKSL